MTVRFDTTIYAISRARALLIWKYHLVLRQFVFHTRDKAHSRLIFSEHSFSSAVHSITAFRTVAGCHRFAALNIEFFHKIVAAVELRRIEKCSAVNAVKHILAEILVGIRFLILIPPK